MALKPEQYDAIELLALPKGMRPTYNEIAEKVGVHKNTIANWRKDEAFQAELKRAIIRGTQERLPEMMDALIDHGIGGNAAAAKLILQANGMLTDNVVVETKESALTDQKAIEERIAKFKQRQQAESQSV